MTYQEMEKIYPNHIFAEVTWRTYKDNLDKYFDTIPDTYDKYKQTVFIRIPLPKNTLEK